MPNEDDAGRIDGRVARRLQTEARLVTAVGEILGEQGVDGLGVNAIASQAGVDKVLIYRYFGGLQGLLRQYGESADFWPSVDELLGGVERPVLEERDAARLACRILENYAAALRRRPITLELLAWECVRRNELTAVLEQVREERAEGLYETLVEAGVPVSETVWRTAGLLAATINYLAVRARDIVVFAGMDIGSEAGWRTMFETFEQVFRSLQADSRTPIANHSEE